MDKFLRSYLDKYGRWLSEKTISHSSRVIPINESFNDIQQMIPSNQAVDLLDKAELITLADCMCRKRYQRCDSPLDVCFILNKVGHKWLEKGLSRQVNVETAREKLTLANKHGLVHLALYRPDHEVFALCSCCSCCCHDLQLILNYDQTYLLLKSDFIARDDENSCTDCGVCIDRCQFNARKTENDKMIYDQKKCTGCGLCITTCDYDAIEMVVRK